MDLTRTIKRNNDCAFQEADGKTVIMLAENSNIFTVNKLGTEIWHLLETPMVINELISSLQEKYNGDDREAIENDIVEFLTSCFKEKIVELAD